MNISESDPQLANSASQITAAALRIPEDLLGPIRRRLYHSTGDGYFIFRNFIPETVVAHMRTLWSTIDPRLTHRPWEGNHLVYAGCPDYFVQYEDGSKIFYNFLFSDPVDEATREVSVAVHMLRNRLAGRNAFDNLAGPGTAVSYRLTINKNYKKWSPMHRDFMEEDNKLQKGAFDPSRLQATLFLSEHGTDYQGEGFKFENNQGRMVVFGVDVPVAPGDLVIWKYGNLHGIENVTTPQGKFGFMRIIYPVHNLVPNAPRDAVKRALARRARTLKASLRARARRMLGR